MKARGAVISVAAALTVVVSTPLGATSQPRDVGVVTAVAGHVTVRHVVGPSRPIKSGDPLYLGDTLEVADGGIAHVVLKGKGTVTARVLSSLHLRDERRVMGASYAVDLFRATLRASAARTLMRQGQEWEQWTVASIRG